MQNLRTKQKECLLYYLLKQSQHKAFTKVDIIQRKMAIHRHTNGKYYESGVEMVHFFKSSKSAHGISNNSAFAMKTTRAK